MQKASTKSLDTLVELSEKYNNPADHYDIIIQLTTMRPKDASYAIDYIKRLNEWGRQALPINDKVTRGKNMSISKNPMKFQEEMSKPKLSSEYTDWHRAKFTSALKAKDYGDASIHYITLVHDLRDKEFKAQLDSKREQLPEFFAYLDAVPGRPDGLS